MENIHRTKIGLGTMILRDGKVLLGKRKNAVAAGEYGFPGGHLEYMESFEECSEREIDEETGLKVKNIRFLLLGNLKNYPPNHYVQISLLADWDGGEAELREPEKCEGWDWYDLNNLPSPLLKMAEIAIDSYRTGRNYYDNP